MPDVARPEKIVDALAYLGLTQVEGVNMAFGCGASGITFPGGVTIGPIPAGGRLEPFTWAVLMPDAPIIRDGSATVTDLDWNLTASLYLDKSDVATSIEQAAPFYGRLLTALHRNADLGGACNSARIVRFALGGDEEKMWLEVRVSAWERLNMETKMGDRWT